MKKYIFGLVSGVIITVLGMLSYDFITKIDSPKIVAYLPYANDYFYSNGKTYRGASPSPANNMPRDINPADPIPLNSKNESHKLTIGVRNLNIKSIEDIRLFLGLPQEFTLIKWDPWLRYSENQCSIPLGNINPGIGHNAVEPIFFKVTKPGNYTIDYIIAGKNIYPIKRKITFYVY